MDDRIKLLLLFGCETQSLPKYWMPGKLNCSPISIYDDDVSNIYLAHYELSLEYWFIDDKDGTNIYIGSFMVILGLLYPTFREYRFFSCRTIICIYMKLSL